MKIEIEAEALESLKRMVKELERDAARYRWLRERGAWETEAFLNGLTDDEFDVAIDDAMKND